MFVEEESDPYKGTQHQGECSDDVVYHCVQGLCQQSFCLIYYWHHSFYFIFHAAPQNKAKESTTFYFIVKKMNEIALATVVLGISSYPGWIVFS